MADKYVDDAATDDTGAGTEADPYKTIKKGYDNIASGDTVHIKAGTYNETANNYLWLDRASIDATFSRNGTGTVDISPNSTTRCLRIATAQTYIFNNIKISSSSGTTVNYLIEGSGVNYTATFNTCDLAGGSKAKRLVFTGVSGTGKKITFVGCTTSGTGLDTSGSFYVYDCDLFELKDGTIDSSNATERMLLVRGTNRQFTVTGNTITSPAQVIVDLKNLDGAESLKYLKFNYNAITGGKKIINAYGNYVDSSPGPEVFMDINLSYVEVIGNTVNSDDTGEKFGFGINSGTDSGRTVTGEVTYWTDGADGAGNSIVMGGGRIINNKIICNASSGHIILLGGNCEGWLIRGNDIDSQDSNDWGIVIKGNGNTICHNKVKGGTAFYIAKGRRNNVYNNEFIGIGTAAFSIKASESIDSRSNNIFNNIFDGSAALYAAEIGSSHDADYSNWFDNNIYIAGSSGFFSFEGAAKTVDEMRDTEWAATGEFVAENDADSNKATSLAFNFTGDLPIGPYDHSPPFRQRGRYS